MISASAARDQRWGEMKLVSLAQGLYMPREWVREDAAAVAWHLSKKPGFARGFLGYERENRHRHHTNAYESHKQSDNAPCLTLDFFNTATPSQILQYFRGLRNADIVGPMKGALSKILSNAWRMSTTVTSHRSVYYIIWTADRPPDEVVPALGPLLGPFRISATVPHHFEVEFWVCDRIDGGAAVRHLRRPSAQWAPAEGYRLDSTPRGTTV